MSSRRPFVWTAQLVAATTALVVVALLTLVSAAPAPAGPPPNRLDDNRGNLGIQTAVNLFVTLPPLTPFFISVPVSPSSAGRATVPAGTGEPEHLQRLLGRRLG